MKCNISIALGFQGDVTRGFPSATIWYYIEEMLLHCIHMIHAKDLEMQGASYFVFFCMFDATLVMITLSPCEQAMISTHDGVNTPCIAKC